MVFAWAGQVTGIGENVVRLLCVILLGYPVAQVYRQRFLGVIGGISKTAAVQVRNNYLLVAGLGLSLLYNGFDIYHSLITTTATYLICYFVGGVMKNRFLSALLIFIFNIVYLTVGYYYNCDGDYDLTWTMPQCVLCLRMIGFGFDYYDGEKKLELERIKPSSDTSKSTPSDNIIKPPTPSDNTIKLSTLSDNTTKLSTLSDNTTKLSTLSDKPIKPPTLSDNTIEPPTLSDNTIKPPTLSDNTIKPPPKVKTVSFAGDCGLTELPRFDHFLSYGYFFSAFLVGPQFSFSLYNRFINAQNLALDDRGLAPRGAGFAAKKCFLVGVVYLGLQQVLSGKFPLTYLTTQEFLQHSFLYRVVYMWFSGKGVITKIKFETATSLDDIVASFNVNTNLWIKDYVFKRLRFLNNKNLSQLGSLLFLALWHGFLTGYFMCFTLEYADMAVEKSMKAALSPYTSKLYQNNSPFRHVVTIACYIYTSAALFYAIVSFGLLRFDQYKPAYDSVYWLGHISLIVLFIACQTVLKPTQSKKVSNSEKIKKQK